MKTDLMSPLENITHATADGLSSLMASGDIAILALTTCLTIALIGNAVQYHVGNRRQEKDFDRYLAVIEALKDVNGTLGSIQQVLVFLRPGGGDNV